MSNQSLELLGNEIDYLVILTSLEKRELGRRKQSMWCHMKMILKYGELALRCEIDAANQP